MTLLREHQLHFGKIAMFPKDQTPKTGVLIVLPPVSTPEHKRELQIIERICYRFRVHYLYSYNDRFTEMRFTYRDKNLKPKPLGYLTPIETCKDAAIFATDKGHWAINRNLYPVASYVH